MSSGAPQVVLLQTQLTVWGMYEKPRIAMSYTTRILASLLCASAMFLPQLACGATTYAELEVFPARCFAGEKVTCWINVVSTDDGELKALWPKLIGLSDPRRTEEWASRYADLLPSNISSSRYAFVCTPETEGVYDITPRLIYGGVPIQTTPLRIEATQWFVGNRDPLADNDSSVTAYLKGKAFLLPECDKTELAVGTSATISYRLAIKKGSIDSLGYIEAVPILSLWNELPSGDGYQVYDLNPKAWSTDISMRRGRVLNPKPHRDEMIDGSLFNTYELLKYAILPDKIGRINVLPCHATVQWSTVQQNLSVSRIHVDLSQETSATVFAKIHSATEKSEGLLVRFASLPVELTVTTWKHPQIAFVAPR